MPVAGEDHQPGPLVDRVGRVRAVQLTTGLGVLGLVAFILAGPTWLVLVGIVLSIADPGKDDAFAGIGFAVPISVALSGGDGEGPSGGGPRL